MSTLTFIKQTFPRQDNRFQIAFGISFGNTANGQLLTLLYTRSKPIRIVGSDIGRFAPHFSKLQQYVFPVGRSEVGTSINRAAVRQANAIEWPPSLVGHQLYRYHVKLVNIRALFA